MQPLGQLHWREACAEHPKMLSQREHGTKPERFSSLSPCKPANSRCPPSDSGFPKKRTLEGLL